jgi:hypothetical protein
MGPSTQRWLARMTALAASGAGRAEVHVRPTTRKPGGQHMPNQHMPVPQAQGPRFGVSHPLTGYPLPISSVLPHRMYAWKPNSFRWLSSNRRAVANRRVIPDGGADPIRAGDPGSRPGRSQKVVVRLGPAGESQGDPSAQGSTHGPRSVAGELVHRQEDLTYECETGEHRHQPDPAEITSRLAPEEQGTMLTIGLDAQEPGRRASSAMLRRYPSS